MNGDKLPKDAIKQIERGVEAVAKNLPQRVLVDTRVEVE
jgi:hypothetical protein